MNKTVFAAVLVAVLGFAGSAVASTDREDIVRSQTEAYSDLAEGEARGYRCELIALEDGRVEAQCDETTSQKLSAACDAFVDATYDASVGSDDRHMAYEACMVIGLHTGAVR
jgi:hypothetical protein